MYLRSLVMIFIITAPLMAGAYMLRENFVLLVFGPKWLEVASIFQWLAPVGLIQALTASTGVVFLALGFTRLMLRLGVVGALLQVAGFVGGLHWGLQGVAAGFMLANLINLFPCFYYVLKVLKLPVNAVCSILLKPSISVGVMVLGLYYLDATHMLAMLSTPLRFLSSVLFGAGIYLFFLFILLRQSIADFRAFLKTG
jgi:PST family polysaccharide transporter